MVKAEQKEQEIKHDKTTADETEVHMRYESVYMGLSWLSEKPLANL